MRAEQYAALGWPVFPVWEIGPDGYCACKRREQCTNPGKHPKISRGVHAASKNVTEVERWFNREYPGSNIGLATGTPSDVVVIDVDPRHGGTESLKTLQDQYGKLPTTLTAYTGGGGFHLFFRYERGSYDELTNAIGVRSGIDVRTSGGYVILAPSKHIAGGSYQWYNWGTPGALLPDWLADEIVSKGSDTKNFNLGSTSSILSGIAEGQRDDTLFRAACRWRRALGDNERRAVEILVLEAARNCEPPFPEDEALRKVEQAFKQDHSDIFDDIVIPGARSFNMTDLGNASRFAYAFGDRYRYVDGYGWIQHSPTGWTTATSMHDDVYKIPDLIRADSQALADSGAPGNAARALGRWAMTTESAGKLEAITKLASNLSELKRHISDYDKLAHEIACLNGVVNLKTGEMRNHHHDDLIIKNTNLSYNPDADVPEWTKFLWESCNGDQDLVDYMQKAAGYSILGHNREEKFFIVSGRPGTGKSTFVTAIQSALGLYATSMSADTILYRRNQQSQQSYDLARLVGVRLVSISEIDKNETLNSRTIKQITGGDEITARHLYQDPFTYTPVFTMWIATNHDPEVHDDAIWRRLLKIPFDHVVSEESKDRTLKDKLIDPTYGAPAVLSWLIKGAMMYLADPVLSPPFAVTAETKMYRAEQDLMQGFINERVRKTDAPDTMLDLVSVYHSYQIWAMSHGEKFIPKLYQFKTEFMRKLRDTHGEAEEYTFRSAPHVAGFEMMSDA